MSLLAKNFHPLYDNLLDPFCKWNWGAIGVILELERVRGWQFPSWIYICTSLVSLADLAATQDCQKTKGRSYLPRMFTLCMRINLIHSASEAERQWELFRAGKGERLVITFLNQHLYILACRNCEIHSLPVHACCDASGWACSVTKICVIFVLAEKYAIDMSDYWIQFSRWVNYLCQPSFGVPILSFTFCTM